MPRRRPDVPPGAAGGSVDMDRRGFLKGAAVASAAVLPAWAGAVPARARALGTTDWMAAIGGATPLRQLSVPGTHDSGARFGGPWVKCQNAVIADQLNAGIRFLDVRCRVTGDSFAIHHAAFYQNLMFGDVLIACRDFLAAHPSETVLMRVKQEYSTESDAEFRRIFDLYLDQKGWRPLFRLDPALPALGEARGKVVLLADNGGLPGVRYGDPALFDIQDDYNAEPFGKYPKIEAQFRKAADQPGKLYVNYVSTAAGLPPEWNADRLNPQVRDFLNGSAVAGRTGLGIVPIDFAGKTPGLIDAVLRHNPAPTARRARPTG
ncbi:phosphatidylinositol-specific phospholipase C domain-containing protein [Streptomyces sp. NPDC059070]|uniref:phosphatidylinositol-specific phospholipase C domain-containing protein n=1 Tax=unclassified Streptomyces TaxID=2593676 RepID=UPI0034E23724